MAKQSVDKPKPELKPVDCIFIQDYASQKVPVAPRIP